MTKTQFGILLVLFLLLYACMQRGILVNTAQTVLQDFWGVELFIPFLFMFQHHQKQKLSHLTEKRRRRAAEAAR